jgi:phosphate-selective porin OprO and OprP
MNRRTLACLLAAGIAFGIGGSARAQDLSTQDMRNRQQLAPSGAPMGTTQVFPPANANEQGTNLSQDDIKKIVAEYLKDQEAKKKADADAAKAKLEDEGYKVGTDLKMSATWKNGLWIETANKDFTIHIGGWIQYDNVFWNQSALLQTAADGRPGVKQGVASGANLGGIGDLQDGTYFRRLRLQLDGTFYETYEYNLVFAMENDQFSTIGLDEFWIGAKDIPLIGTARLGHVKDAVGFEGDMTASSKTMTFMERSSYSEAIERNENFVTGLWLGNNYFDQRATWSFVAFREDQASATGVFFGDGQYGLQGRLTALPIWEEDGRCWTHVGLSGGWRSGTNNINGANGGTATSFRSFQLRARPELRDDDPASAGGGGGATGGAQTTPDANNVRMVDTGVMVADSEWLCGLEFCSVWGPFSVQAEYGLTWIEDVIGFNPKAGAPIASNLGVALKSPTNYFFSGGYIQLAYTLTGENRAYDKRLGRLNTFYFGSQGPYNNAWFVRGDDGHYSVNWGAWEVAARYSYLNLNDGENLNRVQGGVMNGLTFGLNWYLNTNLKFQFDYVYDQRSDLAAGAIPGQTSGLGMRMQFMY